MPLVSLRGYARHRGVSLRAVQKAIRSGRIVTETDGRIDIARADADWNRNTAVRSVVAGRLTYSVPVDPPERTRIARIRDSYLARLAQIEYEERIARLVDPDVLETALMRIPARMARIIARESDPGVIERILTTAIRNAIGIGVNRETATTSNGWRHDALWGTGR